MLISCISCLPRNLRSYLFLKNTLLINNPVNHVFSCFIISYYNYGYCNMIWIEFFNMIENFIKFRARILSNGYSVMWYWWQLIMCLLSHKHTFLVLPEPNFRIISFPSEVNTMLVFNRYIIFLTDMKLTLS